MKSFLILFCAFLISGATSSLHAITKSEQVERYLGTYRYKHDRPLGTVKFIFQRAVLKRRGDGKKTYEQLLFNENLFSNRDNAGKLIGIELVTKGKTKLIRAESSTDPDEVEAPRELKSKSRSKSKQLVKEEPAPEPAEEEPETPPKSKSRRATRADLASVPAADEADVRARLNFRAAAAAKEIRTQPRQEEPEVTSTRAALQVSNDPMRQRQNERPGGGIHMPDSTTLARNIDDAKKEITTWKGRMWQTVRPVWEFVMWVFSSIIVMLICFAGLCRYVAKTAASESLLNSYGRIIVGRWIVSAHQNAAAMLLIITWVIAIVLLIDVFMWLVFLNLPIWTMLFIWFPILWVAEKLTSWIVPNIPVIGPRV